MHSSFIDSCISCKVLGRADDGYDSAGTAPRTSCDRETAPSLNRKSHGVTLAKTLPPVIFACLLSGIFCFVVVVLSTTFQTA